MGYRTYIVWSTGRRSGRGLSSILVHILLILSRIQTEGSPPTTYYIFVVLFVLGYWPFQKTFQKRTYMDWSKKMLCHQKTIFGYLKYNVLCILCIRLYIRVKKSLFLINKSQKIFVKYMIPGSNPTCHNCIFHYICNFIFKNFTNLE